MVEMCIINITMTHWAKSPEDFAYIDVEGNGGQKEALELLMLMSWSTTTVTFGYLL